MDGGPTDETIPALRGILVGLATAFLGSVAYGILYFLNLAAAHGFSFKIDRFLSAVEEYWFISFCFTAVPSILGGMALNFLLRRDGERGQATLRKAVFKGGLTGWLVALSCCLLVVILIGPPALDSLRKEMLLAFGVWVAAGAWAGGWMGKAYQNRLR
jgi:hypothetical protein